MVDQVSYKSIRDQLVSLSVDIEDKVKVCALLRRNIENERQQLGSVEESVKKEFERQLEAEMERHREHSSQKTSISQELVQRKRDLMNRCSELVAAVQDQERDLATEVRAVYRDAETTIENEKKVFRSGYEDRLQKFLASKNAEYKESAIKALNPNITRLQMQHEQELAEAQMDQQTSERALRESLAAQLQAQLEDERVAAKEELKLSIRSLQDKASVEIDAIKREHRKQVQRLGEEQERDLERHRLQLHEKAQRAKDRSHAELKQAQEESQQRVMELQQRHAKHLESLQEEHENELNALRKQAKEKRRALQSEMRRELRGQRGGSGGSEMNDSDSDNDGRSSTRSKASSASKASSSYISSFSPKRSSPNRKPSAGSLCLDSLLEYSELTAEGDNSSSLAMEHLAEEDSMDAEQELEIAAVLRAGQEDRDRQLQAEIRALESETLRLERQWRAKAEAEEKQALAAVAKEEEYSSLRNRRNGDATAGTVAGDDPAELVVTREKLLQQVQALRSQTERAAAEEADAQREVTVYREGIAAHRARIRDKQEQHSLQLREVQLEYGPRLRELREKIDTITAQIREGDQLNKKQLVSLEKEHAVELARLDTQVKGEVGRREEEIAELRDAVEAENAKIARLEKLIKQYSDRSAPSCKSGAIDPHQVGGGDSSSVRSAARGVTRTIRVNGGSAATAVSGGASVGSDASRTSSAGRSQRLSSHQRLQQQPSAQRGTADHSAEASRVSNDIHSAPSHRDEGSTRAGGTPMEITVRSSRNSSRSSSNSRQNVSAGAADRASRSTLSATERLQKQRHADADDNDSQAEESSRWHHTAPIPSSAQRSSRGGVPSEEEGASSTESEPEEPQPVPSWIRRKQQP